MFAIAAGPVRALLVVAVLLLATVVLTAQRATAAEPPTLVDLQNTLANEALPSYREKAFERTIAICERALTQVDALGDVGPEATQLRARFLLLAAGSHDFLRRSERAVALYEAFLRASEGIAAEEANRANARGRLTALRGFVILRVTPREATVTIDGQLTAVPDDGRVTLPPGPHLIHVELLGYHAANRAVELAGGAELEVPVVLAPLAPPAAGASARAVGAWIAAGVGVAGAVTGIVGVVMAADKRARIENAADGEGVVAEEALTRREALELESDANTLSTAALAGFIVAAVGAATATTLLLLPDPEGPTVRADTGVTGFRIGPVERGAMVGWGTRF